MDEISNVNGSRPTQTTGSRAETKGTATWLGGIY